MNERYRWSDEGYNPTHYLMDNEGTGAVGYVVHHTDGSTWTACNMSNRKWEWRVFDNLEDAKAWLLVCVRMNHAV